jgi:hypothetical protein
MAKSQRPVVMDKLSSSVGSSSGAQPTQLVAGSRLDPSVWLHYKMAIGELCKNDDWAKTLILEFGTPLYDRQQL